MLPAAAVSHWHMVCRHALGFASHRSCPCWQPVRMHALSVGVSGLRAASVLSHTALQSKEAAKGRFWFVETDLRSGTAIRMDKTGKSILMLLRHLGRLQEVSAASPGSSASLQQAQALAVGWQCRTSKPLFEFATN